MSYLFPVPARPQRSLLDFKAEHGGVFSEDEATMDMMLMMDRGETKPERFLAKRWGWNSARVHRQKKALEAAAKGWREWNTNTTLGLKQAEAEVKQAEAKSTVFGSENAAPEAEVKQAEAEVKQALYIYPRASELDRTTELQNNTRKNSDNNEELNAGETAPPSTSSSFDLSFLSDRDLNYEPDIRAVLASYRRTDARDLLVQQWRRRRVPPTNGITQLLKTHGWEVYAAAVVISSDTDAPNLNFLSSICQRLTAQRHEQHSQNIQTVVPAGGDPAGSGIPIYDITAHAGRAMPGGVPPRGAGGRQSQSRRQSAFKKPGERSRLESLYANGYTDPEIAAMYPEEFGYLGSVGSTYRGVGDDEAPARPLVAFRSGSGQGAA